MCPFPKKIKKSAEKSPEFVGGFVRSSTRSISGMVFVAVFRSPEVASKFAKVWASRIPKLCRYCACRHVGNGLWGVSVPCLTRRSVFLRAWAFFKLHQTSSFAPRTFSACLKLSWGVPA